MMNQVNKQVKKLIPVCMIGVSFLFACAKKKVPAVPAPPEPTLWEKVNGHYKMYDTTGVYLYDMNIVHIHVNDQVDSLRFENFDGEFTFTTLQSTLNFYSTSIGIDGGDTLYDLNHKRWKLYGPSYLDYNNFINDTIKLRFNKTNINYYIMDVTPYYACNCKKIAVKQH
ncbi:hypothetical protein [Fluviicola sp.]|jgi:hypothetical protein|uniref:hypothetical protein n=1 Tax=Fluviicola sp. TaxID=1917219 RepID=UPI00281F22B5|nr:hypothetical protein [Fluviicola sp.]MDR0802358.1 hypothetical protein [Fluviicola sp.]